MEIGFMLNKKPVPHQIIDHETKGRNNFSCDEFKTALQYIIIRCFFRVLFFLGRPLNL
jgi:hypothetical protein